MNLVSKIVKRVNKLVWQPSNMKRLKHRDLSLHIEIECLAVAAFAKLGCFVRQICFYIYSLLLKF